MSNIPDALKPADIGRFATRAAQVEKAKPAVAYWSYYWIVQQIISKGLHSADAESAAYTTNLMDKLERMKAEHSEDDSIMQDDAGQAVVEQFGLEIFRKADNAMGANSVTRQTADTFLAAAAFLDLLHIWPPVDPETASKTKYAKYHALRIAKALKAGEDPNLSNPILEPAPSEESPPLDPNDPEVLALNRSSSHQATVEEIEDEHLRQSSLLARTSSLDQSLHPSRAPSIPRPASPGQPSPSHNPAPYSAAENFYHATENADVSPLKPSSEDRARAAVGGYFPAIPDDISNNQPPKLPEAPPNDPGEQSSANVLFPSSTTQTPDLAPSHPPFHTLTFPAFPGQGIDSTPGVQVPPTVPYQTPPTVRSAPSQHATQPAQPPARRIAPQITPAPPEPVNFVVDEEAVAKAQKHARWAISALNFEDVTTAIEELRGALRTLGAA